ncbi:hypothetical protein FZC66_12325 [Priestia megaterium]|nr:hypothetical protein FZC66_12325 [Priestia megaterium]
MKKIIFILVLIVAFVYADEYLPLFEQYVNNDVQEENINILSESEPEESQETVSYSISEENLLELIGKHPEQLMGLFGEPDRVDLSAYGYDWWVYKKGLESYMQVGVQGDRVVSVYAIGNNTNAAPFAVGQTRDEVTKQITLKNEVELTEENNYYRFRLNNDDMKMRPLVKYGEVYIQLYFDQFLDTLSSIRVIDAPTLLKQRPYEIVYRGQLPEAPVLQSDDWKQIEEGAAQQILDITNVIRQRHKLPLLEWDQETANVAYLHSKEMSDLQYFAHDSPVEGDLGNRLQKGDVMYQRAGENIASNYPDGIAAVEGWLNSEGHRKALLNKEFTHLGVGVYEKYYTQNFITPLN